MGVGCFLAAWRQEVDKLDSYNWKRDEREAERPDAENCWSEERGVEPRGTESEEREGVSAGMSWTLTMLRERSPRPIMSRSSVIAVATTFRGSRGGWTFYGVAQWTVVTTVVRRGCKMTQGRS